MPNVRSRRHPPALATVGVKKIVEITDWNAFDGEKRSGSFVER
jgi:hypothetical protein